MKEKLKLIVTYFMCHFLAISFTLWLLKSFKNSYLEVQNMLILTFFVSLAMSLGAVFSKLNRLKKIGVLPEKLSFTKSFKTQITSQKSPEVILLEILDNYQPKALKVKTTQAGFKLFLKPSIFEIGEIIEVKTLSQCNNAYELELSSQPHFFFEFMYDVANVKSVNRLKTQFQEV